MRQILNSHQKVFEGIGEIKNFEVQFSMKPVTPIAQKPRPVAYHLQEPLKKWLENGVKEGIFEPIPDDEPVTWCSPLVVQPKPKFSEVAKDDLEPHMIRASIDLRVPNQFMERHRVTAGPIVEDFVHKFHDCKVFSKLDMRSGYHQLALKPESRNVATFSTPWGNVRPRRLVFGAKSSQDLFDEVVYKIFGNIPRCLNQRDDILIGGVDMKEHNEVLKSILSRAEEYGVTFSREKCMFGVDSIPFYGYEFTKDGLKPSPEKVKAISAVEKPKSKSDVRSFLGMVSYLSKFIPRYSSIAEPLRRLTEKNTKFEWSEEHEKSFKDLITQVISADVIAFFDPKKPTMVRCEASFNEGLSAGLFQKHGQDWKPVHFISKAMTPTQKNYSQTEKDALSLRWAKERFRMYLLGAPRFRVVTAHKPLLPFFNKATAKIPPRIEKWVMDMQDVDFELVYEPGRDEADPLDYNSRHPLPLVGNDDIEKVIKSMIIAEHAVVLDKFKGETRDDPVMQKLKKAIVSGEWEKYRRDPDVSCFYPIRWELYIAEDLILRMNQIVIPKKLQHRVVKSAHKMGHLGITKTKRLVRDKYWFPGMDGLIEELLSQCFECKVTTKQRRSEPVKMTEIPSKPWDTIAVDFGGPYPDHHYNLVAVDKRTRYPEVEDVRSTNFRSTREKLKKMFSTHGVPRKLESDNGPPFNSKNFKDFAVEEGFEHHPVTPAHARANGTVESFMKMLNKTEQIAHLTGTDRVTAVQDMLSAYRATPHPATNVSPYEAMMNRTVRTKLDQIIPDSERYDMDESDRSYKAKNQGLC